MRFADTKPFTPTLLEEEKESGGRIFTVRLNEAELAQLEEDARFMGQEKLSTAIKQLAKVGHYVIHDPLTRHVLDTLFINERRNSRLGITIPNPEFTQK